MKRILSFVLILAACFSFGTAFAKEQPYRTVDVLIDNTSYGTAAAPADYSLSWEATDSGTYESIGWPIHLQITATSADNGTMFIYWSPRDFLDVISGSKHTQKHSDFGFDTTTRTYMLRYKTAAQWADHVAANYASVLGAKAVNEYESAPTPELEKLLKSMAKESKRVAKKSIGSQKGITVGDVTATYANRFYSMTVRGVRYRMNVITFTGSTTMDFRNATGDKRKLCSWVAPATWVCICPDARSVADLGAFGSFYKNTCCNNTFMNMNYDLNAKLRSIYLQDYSVRISTAYDDAFSDYIFDQNRYVTQDGESVKISTAYDYVWEQNGTVYFSDSASAMPYGATRLYAK